MMLDKFERDEGIRHFERGMALERANRIMEAVEEYRQAIARYPHLGEAHAALGFYYQRNGLLARAAEAFHAVAQLEGGFLAYFNLGHILVDLERYDEALEAFGHCVQLEPDDAATHFEIAYTCFLQGDVARALDHGSISLQHYPEDWEVLNLMGKCHLNQHKYDNAVHTFTRALHYATTPQARMELRDNITMVERYREFDGFDSAKDVVYAQAGAIYLGSAQDDGLIIDHVQDYHFTYPDIATTIHRLHALHQAASWRFSAITTADSLSHPLAHALSHLWGTPLRSLDELTIDDNALLVLTVSREAELMLLAREQTPCELITFCLGVNWLRHGTAVLPDIIGITAHKACSVPWEPELHRMRADGARTQQVAACLASATTHLLSAIRETPPDKNVPCQTRYYTHAHRRLNFCPPGSDR